MAITLKIINNFSSSVKKGSDYFGHHYSDDKVWLFFLNTSGKITYTPKGEANPIPVNPASSLQLSAVKDGIFTLSSGENSTKLFAGLGTNNPFSGVNGPGVFDTDVPYALAEWTIKGNRYDNLDISYIDSFSFPTVVTVKDGSGTETGKSGFKAGTKASDVITALEARMTPVPVGPNGTQKPKAGQVGYGPEIPTISGDETAKRWVGSTKNWISGPDSTNMRSMYIYAPRLKNYLQYLHDNEPTAVVKGRSVKGWYIDYPGNNGYSGFLSITGNAETGYGLEVHNIRVNTKPSAANDWEAQPDKGTSTIGTITVATNNSVIEFPAEPSNKVSGLWTDAVIYSGAAVLGTIGGGPVVTASHDFASGEPYEDIVATFLASISASMTTGLLGSEMYMNAYKNPKPKATMYWFNTLSRANSITKLFDKAWSNGEEYYDPFWATLAKFTDNQGYLSPFNDRWSKFSPDLALEADSTIEWELGLTLTT